MKKNNQRIFICGDCGNESINWSGKCAFCGAWNTLTEVSKQLSEGRSESKIISAPQRLAEIKSENNQRFGSGISEFDRVLGGGMVPGSLILFSGEPGIGKTTLLSQVSAQIKSSLYVSAEESSNQVADRFKRLKLLNPSLKVLSSNDLDSILKTIEAESPNLVVIDSIQTIASDQFPSTAGSVIQVKECALKIQQLIKRLNIATIIVGQVTKGGELAGPKLLEHLVDVVIYLEGERYHNGRILRGIKNRYGNTDEIGIFEMTEAGFAEVNNPSLLFLDQKISQQPGSAIAVTYEGSRPLMVEVQALCSPTTFGYPKRTSVGFDLNRLSIIIAILNRRTQINLNNHDVYLNLTGGIKINEPALDLAVAMALSSALKNKPLPDKSCFFGELGLSGEIRTVQKTDQRKKEAKKLGYSYTSADSIDELIKQNL